MRGVYYQLAIRTDCCAIKKTNHETKTVMLPHFNLSTSVAADPFNSYLRWSDALGFEVIPNHDWRTLSRRFIGSDMPTIIDGQLSFEGIFRPIVFAVVASSTCHTSRKGYLFDAIHWKRNRNDEKNKRLFSWTPLYMNCRKLHKEQLKQAATCLSRLEMALHWCPSFKCSFYLGMVLVPWSFQREEQKPRGSFETFLRHPCRCIFQSPHVF